MRRRTDPTVSAPEDGRHSPKAPAVKSVLGLTATPADRRNHAPTDLGPMIPVEGLAVTEVDEMAEAFEKGLRVCDIITRQGHSRIRRSPIWKTGITEAKTVVAKIAAVLVRPRGAITVCCLGFWTT